MEWYTDFISEGTTNYFTLIDSHEKAYVFGLLWADGSINQDSSVRLECKDEELTKSLVSWIGGTVYPRSRLDKRTGKIYDSYQYCLCSRESVVSLKTLGFRKSIDAVPTDFLPSFFLGFFDGDGCLYSNKNNCCYQVSFAGSKEVDWELFRNKLPKTYRDWFTVSKSKTGSHFRASGKKIVEFMSWIYTSPVSSLMRKRERYLCLRELLIR